MKHPEALLMPVLMLLDHFLTVWGSIQREKKHAEHFKITHYELNPVWQKSIAQKKWFNLPHTLITIGVSMYIIWMANYIDVPDEIIEGMLGALIGCFGMIVGRHVSNLLIFRYYIQNPDGISGQVAMSHPLLLATSSYQYITVLLPIGLIAICSGSSFAYGGVAGISLSLFSHFIWWIKAKRRVARA
jgi:hypothetical protein